MGNGPGPRRHGRAPPERDRALLLVLQDHRAREEHEHSRLGRRGRCRGRDPRREGSASRMSAREMSVDEAAALVRATDTLATPLGPGAPTALLHALGARDDWVRLEVFGGLLLDLFTLFTKPGVRYLSGFFGPAERLLIDNGADIEFLPADFRRFATMAERFSPRVMTTMAAPPDEHGNMSLSLHAGATVRELHRAAADPERVVIVEASTQVPRTMGLPPEFPHVLHVDEVDVIVPTDTPPFVLDEPPPTDVEKAIAACARSFISDGCTLQTGIGGIASMVDSILAAKQGCDCCVHWDVSASVSSYTY